MRGEINEVLAQVIATRKVSEKQKWGAHTEQGLSARSNDVPVGRA